uniref:Uncharacterized protein n=1 Tax=Anguilla anguilla TaxID=7936 RepID=A0A0E9VZB8_ANGAN
MMIGEDFCKRHSHSIQFHRLLLSLSAEY